MGALVLLPFMLTALVRFPAPKQAQGFPIAAAGRIVRDPMLLLMGIMLFVESGMEISVGGWTATFFKEELGLSEERALVLLSLYWLGMMLTRLVLGPVLRRASGVTVLFSCIGVGLVGALMTVNAHGTLGAGAGVFLIGCGLAQTFPVVLGFVGDRYAELSGTAFSVVIIMALVGGMLMPYGMGVLGAAYGLRGSFMLIPAALVLLATLLALLSHARIAVAREHAGRVE